MGKPYVINAPDIKRGAVFFQPLGFKRAHGPDIAFRLQFDTAFFRGKFTGDVDAFRRNDFDTAVFVLNHFVGSDKSLNVQDAVENLIHGLGRDRNFAAGRGNRSRIFDLFRNRVTVFIQNLAGGRLIHHNRNHAIRGKSNAHHLPGRERDRPHRRFNRALILNRVRNQNCHAAVTS